MENLYEVRLFSHDRTIRMRIHSFFPFFNFFTTLKSSGNAFFVLQFLDMLKYEKNLLSYDKLRFLWTWDLERIASDTNISDNVAELVMHRIKRLEAPAQESLRVAACLGFKFDSVMLQTVLKAIGFDWQNLQKILNGARKRKLITETGKKNTYRFAHDRIHKAAYSLTPDGTEQDLLHKRIGVVVWQNIRDRLGTQDAASDVFIAAYQLNRGVSQIEANDQDISKTELAEINLHAATEAISKSAYFPAGDFLNSGLALLGQDCWQEQYDLTINLTEKNAQVQCVLGNFSESKAQIDVLLKHAKSDEEKLQSYLTLVDCLAGQGKPKEQLRVGKDILRKELGIKNFPKNPTLLDALMFSTKVKKKIKGMSDDQLLNLPKMKDSNKLTALNLMCSLCMCAFFAEANALLLCLFLHSFDLTVEFGISDHAGHAFALYSAFLALLEDFEGSYRFAVLSEKIQAKLVSRIGHARLHQNIHAFATHWRRPIHDCLDPLLTSYRIGMEVGDIEYAMHVINSYLFKYLECGLTLGPLVRDVEAYAKQMLTYKQALPYEQIVCLRAYLKNVREASNDPTELNIDGIDLSTLLTKYKQEKKAFLLQMILYLQLRLSIVFCDFHRAKDTIKSLYGLGNVTKALHGWHLTYAMETLVYVQLAREGCAKWRYKSRVKKLLKMMRNWASKGAINVVNYVYLMEAEYYSLSKDPDIVRNAYNKAINSNRRTGFLEMEALCCERAATYFHQIAKEDVWAKHFFNRAFQCYLDWGAYAKCEQMKELYPLMLNSSEFVCGRGSGIKSKERFDISDSLKHQELDVF